MKLWKRILLKVPKVGLAYRAFRLHKKAKLVNKVRRILKAIQENPEMLFKALKSKLVWLGLVQIGYSVFEVWASGGVVDADVITTAFSGAATIFLRAVTSVPLSGK